MLGKPACLYPSFGFPPVSKNEALPQVGHRLQQESPSSPNSTAYLCPSGMKKRNAFCLSLSHTDMEKFGNNPKQKLSQGQAGNTFLACSTKRSQHSSSLQRDTKTLLSAQGLSSPRSSHCTAALLQNGRTGRAGHRAGESASGSAPLSLPEQRFAAPFQRQISRSRGESKAERPAALEGNTTLGRGAG